MSNKGSELERHVSKYLTVWLTGNKTPTYFWRSPSSGMLGTVYDENIHLKGDVIPIKNSVKKWWPFVVECKNGYPKTSFWQHFTKFNFSLEDFWKQTVEETPKNKHPVLVYRKKGRTLIVGIDKYVHERLYIKLKDLNYIKVSWSDKNSLNDCFLYNMDDFFSNVKPNDIKKLVNK